MYLGEDESTRNLREELRAYFRANLDEQTREEVFQGIRGERYRKVIRTLGDDGWLVMGWPVEYGGRGSSAREQLVFFEEAALAGLPLPLITINTVGPTLMSHGSKAHREYFLPRIAKGDVYFAIGYSEAGSGTDLASLKTKAIKDGDDYLISGAKVFTSGAQSADYIWLAARTDPDAKPHKGISIFMLDTRLEGFSHTPITTLGNTNTTATYYDEVRVPASMLVGELNQGWRLITSQLNFERIGLATLGIEAMRLFDRAMAWIEEGGADIPSEDEHWVEACMAEAYARLEALRLMNARMAGDIEQDRLEPGKASAVKVYGTECMIRVTGLLIQVLGPLSVLRRHSPGAVLQGELESFYQRCQILTFGGGVNEIQREIIASFSLGMPRVVR